jgi:hypothetical protein
MPKGEDMGNGGLLPDGLQGKLVIVPALNIMFGSDLQKTKNKFILLRNLYQKLGEHDDTGNDKGVARRQRTLRHVAWLLTAETFDKPVEYPYPNTRFQLWLRYLTWIEHVATNYQVTVNGQPSRLKPAAAIKKAIILALQNNTKIVFDWDKAPGPFELTVDVVQNVTPMTIAVKSIKGEDIPATVLSDYDDILDKN